MATYESGRESLLFDSIISGKKTIEGRLNRGKFADYTIGDQIWLRRDYRDEYGILHDGEPRQALVEVVGIRHYSTFIEMVTTEKFKRVVPYAGSPEEAAQEYNQYYSTDEQQQYGVLAIEIGLLEKNPTLDDEI